MLSARECQFRKSAHGRFARRGGRGCRLAPWLFGLTVLGALQAAPLVWEQGDGFRRAKLEVPAQGRSGFHRLDARALGILFSNRVSETKSILNRNLLNGSGVAVGDIDGDGWCDLYFGGLEPNNALYRNLGGWKFQEITDEAGVGCPDQDGTGSVFSDVDGDGDLDLLVSALRRGVRLFLNDGQGRFSEATDQAGLRSTAGSMSMALGDVDGDGDLDLYVANYRSDTIADMPTITFQVQTVAGQPVVARVNGQPATLPQWTNRFQLSAAGNVVELGEPDCLYLNDGQGRFSPLSFTGGAFLDEDGRPLAEPPRDWGLTVQMHDFTGDGAPDIYVCNDFFTPDRIWINNGQGRFRAIARTALRTTSVFSMGVDFADIDRDGHVDIFVCDMLSPDHRKRHVQLGGRSGLSWPIGVVDNRPQISRNTLQRNRGDGTFAEISFYAGVEASDWTWSPVFLDVDLDGYEDLLVSNGVLRDFQNIDMSDRIESRMAGRKLSQSDVLQFMNNFPTLETPNVLYRNRGDWTFEEVGEAWGFATPIVSQGMALADLDQDGDLDLIVNNLNASPGLYRNESHAPRLAVRLQDKAGNTQGVGARVTLQGGPVRQSQEMICGGRYLSGSEAVRVFAAQGNGPLTLEVVWRNGARRSWPVEPDYVYELSAAGARAEVASAPSPPQPLFQLISDDASLPHVEQPFDELSRQPLLLKYLSQLGPGVCWHDIDADGWEDLIVGTGRGGTLTVLQNRQGFGFSRVTNAPFNRPLARDQTAILGMSRGLISGSSNYEDGSTNGGLVRVYDLERRAAGDSLLGYALSCGPLALADIDADGDLDLFVGGRVLPGRYPEGADSLLFKNEGGRLVSFQRWAKLGLVSGAVFSDLDQDGYPELLLATEWGPLRAFQLVQGRYQERTEQWGLQRHTGWWNGIATGDLDGDGQLEIVASNWGLNSAYRTSRAHPRTVYYGDLDGNGSFDVIEARFLPQLGKVVPERTYNIVRAGMPFLQERVASYEAYSGLSVEEIYGKELEKAATLQANTFASMVFRFRQGQFEAQPLPPEAQWAPAYGVCVGDLDGDGIEDVFLSQNFFALAPAESRCDAGRGLLLRGAAGGKLHSMPGQESGIEVYGEQRGSALCDYDGDGRVDLAVAQNGNATRIYRNVRARPGLRIRLQGPPANPHGVGSAIRLEGGSWKGPVREVQAGSGYWSQNSPLQVMSVPEGQAAEAVWVRWPGGRISRKSIPQGAREIRVAADEAAGPGPSASQ